MSKSLIQTANQSSQSVTAGSVINLGAVLRRIGCNCRLNGNAIEIDGSGYYTVTCSVTLEPVSEGMATVALLKNGTQITGAAASGTASAAGNSIALPIVATVKQGCCCDGASSLTFVLTSGDSTVTNISVRVEKL